MCVKVQPQPLRATSPTQAERLRACFLQVAFSTEPSSQQLVFKGPAARLGSVCHKILELAARGYFDNEDPYQVQVAFRALWDQLIQQQVILARQSPLEQHLDNPERWPHYHLKRALLLSQVGHLITISRNTLTQKPGSGQASQEVEKTYRGFGGWLTGRLDRVVRRGKHIEIEDFKTGSLAGTDDSSDVTLRESYRRQLLLYAALYRDNTGIWPQLAHLISLDGARASIEVNPTEAQALVDETLALLARYNQLVESSCPPCRLATPSTAACKDCSYKALCAPFWDAVLPTWDLHGAAHVTGRVVDVVESQAGGRAVAIDVTAGNRPPGRYRLRGLTPARFPHLDNIRDGCHVRVLAATPGDDAGSELRPNLYTQIWWRAPDTVPSAFCV